MFSILVVIQCIGIGIMFMEAAYIFLKWKTRLQGILFFSCIATLINSAGYLLEMLANSEQEYLVALKFSYAGRVWIPFALLIFVFNLINLNYKKIITICLSGIHALVYGLVFTLENNTLYYSSRKYVENGLFAHEEFTHGIIYNIYSAIIIIYIVVGLSMLFNSLIKEKNKKAKKRLLAVFISIAIECIFYIIGFTNVAGAYDMTVLGYTIGTAIMCIAILKFDLLDTLELAKDFVVDEISEGIVIVNQEGKLEYMNKIAKDLSKNRNDFLAFLDKSVLNDRKVIINDRIYYAEKRILRHKDEDRGYAYVMVDDTEHYNYMVELKEQKELAEEARAEAESANASKSAFLSVVSHEIRTPMNAVVGMTDLILREPDNLNDKQKKYLNNIKNSGSALVMIVNDILDQSKIEAGKMEIIEDVYEFQPMISDVIMIIENRIETQKGDGSDDTNKAIKVITEIADDIPQYLIGDSLRIRQILINLMNNAVKFTEEGYIKLSVSRIYPDANEERMLLRFSVEDTGQGIKADDLNRLGQAFSQVDTKRNHNKEGTGLGLSISKDFVSMMGGRLEVSSEYGKGTEFFFSITQGIGKPQDISRMTEEAFSTTNFVCNGAEVLVVDDTEINLMIMEEMLKPLEIKVTTVASGNEVVELTDKNKFDIIFMDYMMPQMDGIETTAKLRSMGVSIPVIALTGDDSKETRERFDEAGIDDFIEKPVNLSRIKQALIKWLPSDKIKSI